MELAFQIVPDDTFSHNFSRTSSSDPFMKLWAPLSKNSFSSPSVGDKSPIEVTSMVRTEKKMRIMDVTISPLETFLDALLGDPNSPKYEETTAHVLYQLLFQESGRELGSNPTELKRFLENSWDQKKSSGTGSGSIHWINCIMTGIQLNRGYHLLTESLLTLPTTKTHDHKLVRYYQQIVYCTLEHLVDSANMLAEEISSLVKSREEEHVPYRILPIIVKRVRTIYNLASDAGVNTIPTKWKALLNVLIRALPPSAILESLPLSSIPSHTREAKAVAFATVRAAANQAALLPPSLSILHDELELFHQQFPHLVVERKELLMGAVLYLLQGSVYSIAQILPTLQYFLSSALLLCYSIHEVTTQDISFEEKIVSCHHVSNCCEDARYIFTLFLSVSLALGKLPTSRTLLDLYNIIPLDDFVVAVKSAHLGLFHMAYNRNLDFIMLLRLVGVFSVMRQRIEMLTVVKYYYIMRKTIKEVSSYVIDVGDMCQYFSLPFKNADDACTQWILPLLRLRKINGVIENGKLILSRIPPLFDFDSELLNNSVIKEN